MQLSPVLLAIGVMLGFLGLAMIPCALVDLATGQENWAVFAVWAFACMAVGGVLAVSAGQTRPRTGPREAFLLTVAVWVILSLAGALPFVSLGHSFSDALFEAVSGLTTTGATVFSGLDTMPPGILLWRAILQWIGGIGIIVMAIAILPFLQVGGMELFSLESSDQTGKFMPRVAEIATQMGLVYIVLTALCAVLYAMSGLSAFDAITHAMTTMSAGGLSTHDASFATFSDTPAPLVAIVFMTLASLPFSLLALALLQGRPMPLLTDPQPRLFIGLVMAGWAFVAIVRLTSLAPGEGEGAGREILHAGFNLVSVLSGTGYATTGYDSWALPAVFVFFMFTFFGGCAGSAAGGLKMFRLEIAIRAVLGYAARMVQPNRVVPVRYAGHTVSDKALQSALVFTFLYFATFSVSALLINLSGQDFITSISASIASVANVGLGLGPVVGPEGNYARFSDPAKWVCTAAMLLGRLEFISVFVVLSPRFWSR